MSQISPRVGVGVQVFLALDSESRAGVLNFLTLKSESHKKNKDFAALTVIDFQIH